MSVMDLTRSRNLLIAAMAPVDVGRLQATATRVQLPLRAMLEQAHHAIEYVYFPESGLASVVAGAQPDRAVEVGLFGRDGMSATSLVLGDPQAVFNCLTQVEGSAIRITAANLVDALEASPSLKALLTGYAHALSIQTACTAWANADLRLEARLARWLLMVDDRIAGNQFNITHEFLSVLLGVRRAGVTQALNALASRRLIDARRGAIGVIDRAGLAALTRGTYGLAEAEYVRVTGIALGDSG